MDIYYKNQLECLLFLLSNVPEDYEDYEGEITIPGTDMTFTYQEWLDFTNIMKKSQDYDFGYLLEDISNEELFSFARLSILIDIIINISDDYYLQDNLITKYVYDIFASYLRDEFNITENPYDYIRNDSSDYELSTDEPKEYRDKIANAILKTLKYDYSHLTFDDGSNGNYDDFIADLFNDMLFIPIFDNYFNPKSSAKWEFHHLYNDWYYGYKSLPRKVLNEMFEDIAILAEEKHVKNLLELCTIKKESQKSKNIRTELAELKVPRNTLFYTPTSNRIRALNLCKYNKDLSEKEIISELQNIILRLGLGVHPTDWNDKNKLCQILEEYIEKESLYQL